LKQVGEQPPYKCQDIQPQETKREKRLPDITPRRKKPAFVEDDMQNQLKRFLAQVEELQQVRDNTVTVNPKSN